MTQACTILFSASSVSGNGLCGGVAALGGEKIGLIGVVIDNILNSLFNRPMSLLVQFVCLCQLSQTAIKMKTKFAKCR